MIPICLGSGGLEQRLSDRLELGDGVGPGVAPQQLDLDVEEVDGVLEVEVGVNGDAHDGDHGADEGALVLLGDRPEQS